MPSRDRPLRTVQIHPTLRCNLTCRHCYSLSSPSGRGTLTQPLFERLVDDMPAEGYTVLAVSGGEPLLWPGLRNTLQHAKMRGLSTALTSNGLLLTPSRLEWLAGSLDLLAISLDGIPATHDRMRGRPGVFASMAARLADVRASKISFGFLFTLTDDNLHELPWVTQFALDQGASLLQVHPLEEVGRASKALLGARPGEITANAAYLAVLRLRDRLAGRLRLQLDLAHRDVLREQPWRAHAGTERGGNALADLVEHLIVESDGAVVPVQYGFPRAHALGSLKDAPLSTLSGQWRHGGGFARFRAHCAQIVQHAVSNPDALPAFNWHEAIVAAPA